MLSARKWTRPLLVLLFSGNLFFAPPRATADEIIVFAAASLTNALGEIGQAFERQGGG